MSFGPSLKTSSLLKIILFNKKNVLTKSADETKSEDFIETEKDQDTIQKELYILEDSCNKELSAAVQERQG